MRTAKVCRRLGARRSCGGRREAGGAGRGVVQGHRRGAAAGGRACGDGPRVGREHSADALQLAPQTRSTVPHRDSASRRHPPTRPARRPDRFRLPPRARGCLASALRGRARSRVNRSRRSHPRRRGLRVSRLVRRAKLISEIRTAAPTGPARRAQIAVGHDIYTKGGYGDFCF